MEEERKKRIRLASSFVSSSEIYADYDYFKVKLRETDVLNDTKFIMAINQMAWFTTKSGYLRCAYVHAKWILFLHREYGAELATESEYREHLLTAVLRIMSYLFNNKSRDINVNKKYVRFAAIIGKKYLDWPTLKKYFGNLLVFS